jgi:ectoine hydroxylase-related dioxygenase (phytanoyl-CoA dioxygenase family)
VGQLRAGSAPHAGPNATKDNGIISTTNVQKYSSVWLTEGLLHDGFLDAAEQFVGPDIVMQHTSLYEKRRTHVVGPFRMHQDWSYGPVRHDTMISGMIHVRRATAAMGALRVYPGTHGTRMENATADEGAADFHKRFPLEGATVIEAEVGDVLFFHYRLVHGSTSNEMDEPRKVVHVRMFSGTDCGENPDNPMGSLVLRGWNYHASVASTR